MSQGKKYDHHKASVYIPKDMQAQLQALAVRTERSFSWLIQYAVRCAEKDLEALQGPTVGK